MNKRSVLVLTLLLLTLGVGGGALWWRLRPAPADPAAPTADAETGMTEEQRIKLMEEIGYIQQE